MEIFCKQLPKIELHAHLNGSLSGDTLKKLGCVDKSIEEYQKFNDIFERNERTLEECFLLFRVAHNATRTKESVYTATQSVINEFVNDNVIYLELRTTPRAEEHLTKKQYIESVIQAIQDDKNSIIVKLILCIDRRHDSEVSINALDLIIDMKNAYPDIIKGIDLCGDPTKGYFERQLFDKARENGLLLSIHCAEIKNDQEVLNIFDFKPERIGHGTRIHPNYGGRQDLWDVYSKIKIPTECCLTSNVLCGTAKSYKEHHILEWIKYDLPFSLCTDDKGVFCTTLSREYLLLHDTFNIGKQDLWKISYNSIEQSFASIEEKEKLKAILNNWNASNIQ